MSNDAGPQPQQGSPSFDQLVVDVAALYRDFPVGTKTTSGPAAVYQSPLHRLYRSSLLPLKVRHGLWRLLRQSHLDLSWYQEFSAYGSKILGGRPLWHVHTVYFLQNVLRQRFSQVDLADDASAAEHLETWQRPELLYQLLHLVVRDSVRTRLRALEPLFRFHPRPRTIYEFGCGNAPVAMSLYEFYRLPRDFTVYISDIDTVAFHYGQWRFRHAPNVHAVRLKPEQDFLPELPTACDAIFCLTVMEHLPDPVAVVRRLHELLNPGGLLLFDYIVSEGHGLDTAGSLRERATTLDFIEQHFDVLSGRIDRSESMPLTVVRKR